MKMLKLLSATAFAVAIMSGSSFATEDSTAKCCVTAKKEGKECAHPCCVTATKNGKECAKCAMKKDDEKKPS